MDTIAMRYPLGIFRLSAHRHQMNVLRQQFHRLGGQCQVLPFLDRTHVQHKALRQLIMFTDLCLALRTHLAGKTGCKTLVYQFDAVGILLSSQFYDILSGTFADGYNSVGLTQCLSELPFVDSRVYPMVVFRVAHENQVVDGHYTADALLTQSDRQFTRQAVIHLNTVALQVTQHTARAPPSLPECRRVPIGIAELHISITDNLSAQVVTPLIRCIQAQLHVAVAHAYEVVHQCTSVAAQSRTVSDYAFRINTNNHLSKRNRHRISSVPH